jgi:hypothetical protein
VIRLEALKERRFLEEKLVVAVQNRGDVVMEAARKTANLKRVRINARKEEGK